MLNASAGWEQKHQLAQLGFQVHPPQQVLEERVVADGVPSWC